MMRLAASNDTPMVTRVTLQIDEITQSGMEGSEVKSTLKHTVPISRHSVIAHAVYKIPDNY